MAHLKGTCEQWDRDPEGRPPVFFTVGDYAVEVKEFEPGRSVCRQFWGWAGLDDGHYDANEIDIAERDEGLHLSLRDQTNFRIVRQDRDLTTTISRAGQVVTGVVDMTDQYPPTPFRNAPWPQTHRDVPAHTLVFWRGVVQGSALHIYKFYSKAGDATTWRLPSGEDRLVRGAGQTLFCAVVKTVPDVQTFTLEASGSIPHVTDQMQRVAASLSDERIMSDLRDGNTAESFEEYMEEWSKNPDEVRPAWVVMQSNRALADYYEKYFGFKAYGDKDMYTIQMSASREEILAHCQRKLQDSVRDTRQEKRHRADSAPRSSKRRELVS